MNENGFGEDFVWYEWSFVSPDDLTDREAKPEGTEEARRTPDLALRPFHVWEVASQ